MAASVLMTCGSCGTQTLAIGDVVLVLYVNLRELSYLLGGCPGCGAQIRKVVDESRVRMLREAGARVDLERVDSEVFDPARKNTEPLVLDLLIDLHAEMDAL